MKVNGVVAMLKKKSPKIVQINDILQWYENDELELSPKYQRNSVWNEKAKSYLMDTIIRGLPIPPIFMRQQIDVATKKTYREVIDGQQRLRAITEYIENKFPISKTHNEIYGGMRYKDLDEETQEQILDYDLFVEVINEKEDPVIYDMFARLNTNNCVLNRQELRNSRYWGEFKVAAYNTAAEYRDLFYYNKIFNDKQFSRMEDVEFISILLNIFIGGIDSDTPTSIDKLYSKFDKEFKEFVEIKEKFDATMKEIKYIYEYLNGNVKCFTSKLYFYTLFAVLAHQLFGLDNLEIYRLSSFSVSQIEFNREKLIDRIIQFENDFEECVVDEDENAALFLEFSIFAKNHRTRTTNKVERIQRVKFLSDYLTGADDGK
ncbi:DUF262 domain-containing protein [[Clostridium] hylemonae]|uniref:DUF262 domain-containing protein n=1 Tax=[Clostridium] hylemonae TaxID=89153 RepID=UPI001FCAAA76|nr:DUF262 domain-containing protein [[Clostridium] hylemonae]BDF05477.1 hypothetical protein CE91St63_25390 [[Clostridium] hylemonae]